MSKKNYVGNNMTKMKAKDMKNDVHSESCPVELECWSTIGVYYSTASKEMCFVRTHISLELVPTYNSC